MEMYDEWEYSEVWEEEIDDDDMEVNGRWKSKRIFKVIDLRLCDVGHVNGTRHEKANEYGVKEKSQGRHGQKKQKRCEKELITRQSKRK